MVAGTNVVYAATDEVTEATEEVAKTDTENQDKKAVDRAIAEYIAKVKRLPVNAATATYIKNHDVLDLSNPDKKGENATSGFKHPADDIEEKYGVTFVKAELTFLNIMVS